jgi:hypothetical protein
MFEKLLSDKATERGTDDVEETPAVCSADVMARLVLRATCVAQISMTAAQLIDWHPDETHQHMYETVFDFIMPLLGLKASFSQYEAKRFDNLQIVSGVSAIHVGEVIHHDGMLPSLLHGSIPHCPHALQLGLYFLAGSSAWLVRQNLPYVEDGDEEHLDNDAEGSIEPDESGGAIEEPDRLADPSSSADPYHAACKS